MKKLLLILSILLLARESFPQTLIDHGAIKETSKSGITPLYVVDGRKWPCSVIKYSFQNYTNDLSVSAQRDAIFTAFRLWSDNANVHFVETYNTNEADIRISWGVRDHGDPDETPFDGSGNVLAHAFFPPPNFGDFAGDVHFDDDETWTVQSRDTV